MTLVPSCQKVPKVKIACSYSKEGDLYWLEDSINVTLKSLFLLARIEKSSNSGVWLQNKRCSLMAESSSPLTLFPVSVEIPKCSHILTLKWRLVLPSFHHEIDKLKSVLYKNSYLRNLVDKYIKEFLDKMLAPKPVVSTVSKKNFVIALPYLGKLSLQIRTRTNRIM